MAPRLDLRLEKLIDRALKHSDFQTLEDFVLHDNNEAVTPKCSKNFINKLDKLINRELNKGNIKHACLGLSCLHKFEKILIAPAAQELTGMVMVNQGLVQKMVSWFEKARKLWIENGKLRNEALLGLAEDFLDALLAIYNSSKEGKCQVTETFLHHIGNLATEPRVQILIQKEAIRKLNVILDSVPPELKKRKILFSEEALALMKKLASRIPESGDYDLQVSLMEALCRMTTPRQREELASSWFKMDFVITAFLKIKDSEFETDTRKFLNLLNGMKGDKRRVYSYPCLEVFLGKHELLMPSDENLEEFWVDFNLESQSISFYFSIADEGAQDGQWDTVCISENEIHHYTVKVEVNRKVLRLLLMEPLCLSGIEGSELIIQFSASLDILHATESVYGAAKHVKFVGKTNSSVVKTTVQISLDDRNSQAVIPETQLSSAPSMGREQPQVLESYSAQNDTQPRSQEERAHKPPLLQTSLPLLQTVTPAKRKVSKSSTFITSSCSRKVGMSPLTSVLMTATPLSKGKVKAALQIVSSSETKNDTIRDLKMSKTWHSTAAATTQCQSESEQDSVAHPTLQNKGISLDSRPVAVAQKLRRNIPVGKVVEMVQANLAAQGVTNKNIVRDSQCSKKPEQSQLHIQTNKETSWRKFSVTEVLLPGQRDYSRGLPKQCESPVPITQTHLTAPGRQPSHTVEMQQSVGEISHQQFHTQLTQRLEKLLQAREQESPASRGRQGKAGGQATQQGTVPELHKTQQKSLKHENMGPSSRPEVTSAEGRKQKKGGSADLTGRMMMFISNQYKSTTTPSAPVPEPCWISAGRKSVEKSWSFETKCKGSDPFLKPASHLKTVPGLPDNDVYDFHGNTPQTNEGLKKQSSTKSSICRVRGSIVETSVKKGPSPVKTQSRCVKKHLFSDTDTDYKTDVSWLKDSAKKPRLKIVQYGRQYPQRSAPAADESADLPQAQPKPLDLLSKPKKAKLKKNKWEKENMAPPVESRLLGRPQRASAMLKSYREPSDFSSSSQSEEEAPQHHQWQPNIKMVSRKTERAVKTTKQSKAKNLSPPPVKGGTGKHKESWAAQFSATTYPLAPIERMRSTDKPVLLPRSPISPLHSMSMSPIGMSPLKTPYPQKGTQMGSFNISSRDNVSTEVPCPPQLSSLGRKSSSAPPASSCPSQPQPSPINLVVHPAEPLLTSTALEMSGPRSWLNCKTPEEQLQESENSPVLSAASLKDSLVFMATQSQGALELTNNPVVLTGEQEKTPGPSSRQSKAIQFKEHQSGPCLSLKRRASPPGSSSSEEKWQKKRDRLRDCGDRLKPRKLFQALTSMSSQMGPTPPKVLENSFERENEENEESGFGKARGAPGPAQKSFHGIQRDCTINTYTVSSCWEDNVDAEDLSLQDLEGTQNLGSACHQLNSDFQRKLKNHSRRMSLFSKQSLNMMQQHVSTACVQVHQYRTRSLENIKADLLQEIQRMEEEESTLKNMEKELTVYWSKQYQAFRSIKEKDAHRLQHLRSTFQASGCHGFENEHRIFHSEICLMKKDMKSIQDKLFRDMHKESLLSVHRALQAWYLPGKVGL
ncbi:synaptonemal complex protein 2 isoform X2 [Brienomyrus brachyistius]|uniref:synaptonemal complex protein 2 isoform X2 n=1 Tax=Brienomyrus brachyistius TaxID=42636 RepID=UPI0020B1F2BA|nr:synaptonemal complex protein 2 isoform X2 [Brienomyrus brachyistius]